MRYALAALLLAVSWPAAAESTPTRERVPISGVWRWQAAAADAHEVPAGGWGEMRVPDSWPKRSTATAAWYQREITIPRGWSGRRITVSAEYLNSYAAVYVDAVRTGEMRYPAGEVDITSAAPPGKHVLSILVVAMPLKAVLLSFNDTASAREVSGKVERKGLCGDGSDLLALAWLRLSSSPRSPPPRTALLPGERDHLALLVEHSLASPCYSEPSLKPEQSG